MGVGKIETARGHGDGEQGERQPQLETKGAAKFLCQVQSEVHNLWKFALKRPKGEVDSCLTGIDYWY